MVLRTVPGEVGPIDDRSVALVHDYLLVMRGAERTFEAIAEIWPEAPISTLLYDEQGTGGRFAGRVAHTSPLQRTGVGQGGFRRLMPVMPFAAAALRVADARVVVSSSSAFAHGVRSPSGATHVCYCHSPFRYAWHECERALLEVPRVARPALAGTLGAVRRWDRRAAARVDHYVANSRITQQRIAELYGREAPIVHPPVDTGRFSIAQPEGYLLVVTELVPHKRVDVALEAARRSGREIKVVGTGPDSERLTALHGSHAEFLGRVDDEALAALYARADALVVPNVEEFGIAAVEAQAAGRPVVGTSVGGTTETVIEGETGVLVPPGDVEALTEALRETDFAGFDPARIAAHARGFDRAVFQSRLRAETERAIR